MSSYLSKVLSVFFVCWFSLFTGLHGEEWMRGAVAVTSVTGEVELQEVGGESRQMNSGESLPYYAAGLLKVLTKSKNAVFLRTSNQISIYNEGAGFFAIERFEQDIGTSMAKGKSRMILNLRQGLLVMDNRALSADSQMIVETPLGRISAKNAWWLMKVAYDERSRIYDFSIECADGVLRFTDQQGDIYTMRNGQRLSGVGVSSRPSIEVAEISNDANEIFEEFTAYDSGLAELELAEEVFRSKMKPMRVVTEKADVPAEVLDRSTTARPFVIEYAPQSEPVTPFRAVIRPPSSFQADLF